MHIYAFGSVCRGEIFPESDIDLLALLQGPDSRFDPGVYSIYSYSRIKQLWDEGNPFAWHLALESHLLFADDHLDYLRELGKPAPYVRSAEDCIKFQHLFLDAATKIKSKETSAVFEFSIVFLAIRNIAICFSLGVGMPVFSRHAALKLGDFSLSMDPTAYNTYNAARSLCTRALGTKPSDVEMEAAKLQLNNIQAWMAKLVEKASKP